MAYKRKPNYHFATKNDTGIDTVPVGRVVVCEDFDGEVKVFTLKNKTAVDGATTIAAAVTSANLIEDKVVLDGSPTQDSTNAITSGAVFSSIATVSSTANGKLSNIVEDTTPQLGGALDCNGNTINKAGVRGIADHLTASGTITLDYGAGDMRLIKATANIGLAFSGFPAGQVCGFIVDAQNWGAFTISHPAGMLFQDGKKPSYTASGIDRLLIMKDKDNVYTLTVIAYNIKV